MITNNRRAYLRKTTNGNWRLTSAEGRVFPLIAGSGSIEESITLVLKHYAALIDEVVVQDTSSDDSQVSAYRERFCINISHQYIESEPEESDSVEDPSVKPACFLKLTTNGNWRAHRPNGEVLPLAAGVKYLHRAVARVVTHYPNQFSSWVAPNAAAVDLYFERTAANEPARINP